MFGVKEFVRTIGVMLVVTVLANVMAHASASDLAAPLTNKQPNNQKHDIATMPVFRAEPMQLSPLPPKKPTPPPEPPIIPQLPPTVDGIAPVLNRLPVDRPVVFLTIDDGVYKNPDDLALLQANKVKATLFLTDSVINQNYPYFASFRDAGMPIEDHTITHPKMNRLPFAHQQTEICATADIYSQVYGRRPQLFRPPYGSYSIETQRAATSCGMKALVMWHAVVERGAMQYQDGDHLLPGDIVLMHFRPEFAQDLQTFIAAQNAAGLHTELLETWLGIP